MKSYPKALKFSDGRSLALETRDSIIITRMSQMKYPSFTMTPKDSLEVKQESYLGLKRYPSKIASAKDSIELARVSLNKTKLLPDFKIKPQTTKESIRCGSKRTSPSNICCSKCPRTKQSIEVMDGIISKRVQDVVDQPSEMGRSSLRISHFQVINVPDNSKSQVSFDSLPNKITDELSDITKIYKPHDKVQSRGE